MDVARVWLPRVGAQSYGNLSVLTFTVLVTHDNPSGPPYTISIPQRICRPSSMPRLTLFGSRDAPWRTDAWKAVDDRIRGGKSQSHLVAVERMDRSTFANFYGNLDIKTLGGAGFASQAHQHPYDLSKFHGLQITIQPSAYRPCKIFNLNIKTELPDRRKDGRNQSVVVYEYEFDVTETMMESTTLSEKEYPNQKGRESEESIANRGRIQSFKAKWEDFKPTYRGRPVQASEAKKLDPAEIKEISIMCRSNFGKQEGDFNLFISDITAFTQDKPSIGTITQLLNAWQWLKNWFLNIFGLRSGGRGFIRL